MSVKTHSPTPRDFAIFAALRTHRRLLASQVRRLFFRDRADRLATPQTVHGRLGRLVSLGYLDVVRLDRGRGSGPYAYGLSARGSRIIGAPSRRRGHPGPLWHDIAVAELRVNLDLALCDAGGELVEWLGEGDLRSLLHGVQAPRPDGLAHWRLDGREGAILFEIDAGTEGFALLTAKVHRYAGWFRSGRHRELVPGLRLRPRVAFVAPRARAARLAAVLRALRTATTVFVGVDTEVLAEPLTQRWWRNDVQQLESLLAS
ncbi:MAG: replication-relaxation family protein [Dehalococcoidia bacterium]